jgi:hypothetical protein
MEWIVRKVSQRESVTVTPEMIVVGKWEVKEISGEDEEKIRGVLAEMEDGVVMKLSGDKIVIGVKGEGGVEIVREGEKLSGWIVRPQPGRGIEVFSGQVKTGEVVRLVAGEALVEAEMREQLVEVPKRKFGFDLKLFEKRTGTVYLKKPEARDRMRKYTWILGGVFVLVVIVLVGVGGYRLWIKEQKRIEQERVVNKAVANIAEARSLLDSDPVKGKKLATEAIEALAKLPEEAKVLGMKTELEDMLLKVSGVKEIAVEKVIDLSLIREDAAGEMLAIDEGVLWVGDRVGKRIMKIDIVRKNGSVVLGSESVGTMERLASYPGKLAIFGDDKVTICETVGLKCNGKIEKDAKWGRIVDIKMFAGNVYLLDPSEGSGKIWRHLVTEAGYGVAQEWTREDESALRGGGEMAIDGGIWVVGEGRILRYVQGGLEKFEIEGLVKPLGAKLQLDTTESGNDLVLLDKENSRIIVVDKEGVVKQDLRNELFSKSLDMVMDLSGEKVYVLDGEVVWGVVIE